MIPRILLELFIVALPFICFGIYRAALSDAEVEGRKAWPIKMLFGIGVVLAILAWLFLLLRDDRSAEMCQGPSTLDPVSGRIIPGEKYDCDLGITPRLPEVPPQTPADPAEPE